MNKTIQLYIDEENDIKGYPITSPDRVIDENGISIKDQLASIEFNNVVPNLQIGDVSTLDFNQQATVTRRGTNENPIFDFGIPKGPQGEKGKQGPRGKDGASVTILGKVDSFSDLPQSDNNKGDGYICNGELYVWTSNSWDNVGNIQGPQGEKGETGERGPQGPKGDSYDATNLINEISIIKNNIVYAKEFGVKADGITDDTLALQRAIDSLKPKNNENLWDYQNCGGSVILPNGIIRITNTIRLYSNIKLIGTNNCLFGRITTDTVLLLDTSDSKKIAISFVGIDTKTKNHSDKLFISGEDMDNGVVTQTWNVLLDSFTIRSKNSNQLAINLSCAVKCRLNNISFNNFDVDVFVSGNWDNTFNDCNTLCNFGHMILASGNSLLINNVYINPTENPKIQLPSNHILYSYVNNANLIYKNTQTAILNIGLHGLNIEKPIVEKLKIGIQSCMDAPTNEKFFNNSSINKIHMEHIERAFVFRNVACSINGVYAYITPNTGEYLIEGYNSNITGINIQPIKHIKLAKEDSEGNYNFFNCNSEWITGTKIDRATIGKTMFDFYNNQAIRKTYQTEVREIINDTVVETQFIDLKDTKTCEINSSKLVITNPPESPVDVRYSNTIILNSSSVKTIYSFQARDFQEFTIIAINNKISLNGRDSNGKLIIKNGIVDSIPTNGVMKFICHNGICYEISRNF